MPRVIRENLSWLVPLIVSLAGGGVALYVKAETGPRLTALEVRQDEIKEDVREIKRGVNQLVDMHLRPQR